MFGRSNSAMAEARGLAPPSCRAPHIYMVDIAGDVRLQQSVLVMVRVLLQAVALEHGTSNDRNPGGKRSTE